jgi:hypothetical protein
MKKVRKSKKRSSESINLFVAVVVRADGSRSKRTDGDWASFTGTNRDLVVGRALAAVRKWENGSFGKYEVQVGTITQRAVAKTDFELKPLNTAQEYVRPFNNALLEVYCGRSPLNVSRYFHDGLV